MSPACCLDRNQASRVLAVRAMPTVRMDVRNEVTLVTEAESTRKLIATCAIATSLVCGVGVR